MAIYDYATAQGMKPPNLKQIAKPVQKRLEREGCEATASHIEKIAESYKDRRLRTGAKAGKLRPFLDLEI